MSVTATMQRQRRPSMSGRHAGRILTRGARSILGWRSSSGVRIRCEEPNRIDTCDLRFWDRVLSAGTTARSWRAPGTTSRSSRAARTSPPSAHAASRSAARCSATSRFRRTREEDTSRVGPVDVVIVARQGLRQRHGAADARADARSADRQFLRCRTASTARRRSLASRSARRRSSAAPPTSRPR